MGIGCKLGILSSNIIAYADDLVLLAPSAEGLQKLIDKAYNEALDIDLKFNYKKTKCIVFKLKPGDEYKNIKPFTIDSHNIDFVRSFRYLGYIISSDLNSNDDIVRARNKFYAQFNMLLRNFHFSDTHVQMFLFRQFCLQIYGCELWFNSSFSKTLFKGFEVGYHKAVKKILKLSYHESNHFACQEAQVFTFRHFIHKCKIMAAFRVLSKPCHFIHKILDFFYGIIHFFKRCLLYFKRFL